MVRVVNYLLHTYSFNFTFAAQLHPGQSPLTTLGSCFVPNTILIIIGYWACWELFGLRSLAAVGIFFEPCLCTQHPATDYCGCTREEDEVQTLLLRNNLEIRLADQVVRRIFVSCSYKNNLSFPGEDYCLRPKLRICVEEAGELNQIEWWMSQRHCPHIHLYNYRQESIIKLLNFVARF